MTISDFSAIMTLVALVLAGGIVAFVAMKVWPPHMSELWLYKKRAESAEKSWRDAMDALEETEAKLARLNEMHETVAFELCEMSRKISGTECGARMNIEDEFCKARLKARQNDSVIRQYTASRNKHDADAPAATATSTNPKGE